MAVFGGGAVDLAAAVPSIHRGHAGRGRAVMLAGNWKTSRIVAHYSAGGYR